MEPGIIFTLTLPFVFFVIEIIVGADGSDVTFTSTDDTTGE